MLEQDYSESSALYLNILALHNPSHRLSSLGRDFGKGKSISHFISGRLGVTSKILHSLCI